jgi:hypothetical protein
LSTKGTSTLLNNALLSAHLLDADGLTRQRSAEIYFLFEYLDAFENVRIIGRESGAVVR